MLYLSYTVFLIIFHFEPGCTTLLCSLNPHSAFVPQLRAFVSYLVRASSLLPLFLELFTTVNYLLSFTVTTSVSRDLWNLVKYAPNQPIRWSLIYMYLLSWTAQSLWLLSFWVRGNLRITTQLHYSTMFFKASVYPILYFSLFQIDLFAIFPLKNN